MSLVFDASSLVLGLYPENFSTKHSMSSNRNSSLPNRLWEYAVNRHLAAVYGSYCYQLPRRHSPMLYKVVKHSEDYMLSKVEELILSNFVIGKEQNVHAEGDSLWSKENICLPGHLPSYSSEPSAAVNVPYSLGKLLQLAADKNRSVVLGVAGASYRDILMSWVCRLRHLRVTNFVVCALDHETYEFSVLEGLPVFRDPLSPKNVSYDNCHFRTQCFQQVTKVKSLVVLDILRLGYNVLLSDVDVYWFDNPGQINEHTHSLRQWVGQSKDKAEKNRATGYSENENSCQLCKVEKLNFEPPPIYCSPCGARIKRNASYYTGSTTEARHHFCTLCYNESRSHTINVEGIQFLKANLEKRRNDDEAEEGWVQCDKCECWQHQICALFNVRRNGEGVAENTYHNCYVQEIKHGLCMPLPESTLLGVKDLPRAVLSIIWLVDKKLEKLEGVEVGLFGMYVQEFGAECAFPNQRRIYLSFLDSIKYFKPEIKTVSGKGLQVKENELPAKVVTCPKRAFNSQSFQSNSDEDGLKPTMEPYGKWQPGRAHALTQYQIDVWSEKCPPPGTVHLRLPRLVQVAKRLGIDFAPAMVGFDYRSGRCLPVFDGIVVCAEFKSTILEACAEDIINQCGKLQKGKVKKYADHNRTERKFTVGEMKVGNVAYKLQLSDGVGIHHVFHVSQLKKTWGPKAIPSPDLPLVSEDGKIKTESSSMLETRTLPRRDRLVTQWLVQWENLPPEDASWEDADFIKGTFPNFYSHTIRSWFPDQNT